MSHLPAGYPMSHVDGIYSRELLFKPLLICTLILQWTKRAQCQGVGHGCALHSYIVKCVHPEEGELLGSVAQSVPPHDMISLPSGMFTHWCPRAFSQKHILQNFEAHRQCLFDYIMLIFAFHDCKIHFN